MSEELTHEMLTQARAAMLHEPLRDPRIKYRADWVYEPDQVMCPHCHQHFDGPNDDGPGEPPHAEDCPCDLCDQSNRFNRKGKYANYPPTTFRFPRYGPLE